MWKKLIDKVSRVLFKKVKEEPFNTAVMAEVKTMSRSKVPTSPYMPIKNTTFITSGYAVDETEERELVMAPILPLDMLNAHIEVIHDELTYKDANCLNLMDEEYLKNLREELNQLENKILKFKENARLQVKAKLYVNGSILTKDLSENDLVNLMNYEKVVDEAKIKEEDIIKYFPDTLKHLLVEKYGKEEENREDCYSGNDAGECCCAGN